MEMVSPSCTPYENDEGQKGTRGYITHFLNKSPQLQSSASAGCRQIVPASEASSKVECAEK